MREAINLLTGKANSLQLIGKWAGKSNLPQQKPEIEHQIEEIVCIAFVSLHFISHLKENIV